MVFRLRRLRTLPAQGWISWDVPHALYYVGSFGPLIAALIVTALTESRAAEGSFCCVRHIDPRPAVGWHFPAFFFRDTYIELGLLGFSMFAIMMVFSTMVFTWLYNSTQGSVFIVIVFHAVFNWFSVSEAGGQFVAGIMSAPIVLWALYVARRYGQENTAPVQRQVA